MTPQLQQAIRLLQLSSLELQAEIQEALETNPLLEVEEDYDYDQNAASRSDDDQASRDISQLENQGYPRRSARRHQMGRYVRPPARFQCWQQSNGG